jgi:hypothetical protein
VRIIIILALVFTSIGYCDPQGELVLCNNALRACTNLVDDQDQSVQALKAYSKQLEGVVKKDEDPIIPWWAWGVMGIAIGAAITYTLHH